MKRSPGICGAVATCLLATLLAGCQAPRPVCGNVQVDLPDEEAYRQFWSHSISSVRHFGYDLDRVDPAAGVITSRPETSKQWFELWRNDTLGCGEVAESSLHTMRRDVRVSVEPTADGSKYLVSVRVNVQRLSMPERQVTTPASAVNAFTERLPTERPAPNEAEAARYWVDMGRDRVLETAILRQISRYPGARVVVSDNLDAAATQPEETAEPSEEPARAEPPEAGANESPADTPAAD